jgi:hypothetical protein
VKKRSTVIYEIWDTETGNIIGAYASERDALTVVAKAITDYGAEYVGAWVLRRTDDTSDPVLEGPELAERARQIPAA